MYLQLQMLYLIQFLSSFVLGDTTFKDSQITGSITISDSLTVTNNLTVNGNTTVDGTLTVRELHTEFVSHL